jgi:hypothetical protein
MMQDALLFVFESNVLTGTRLQQYHEGGGGFARGTYYIPQTSMEREQLSSFTRKFKDYISAQHEMQPGPTLTDVIVSTQSSTNLQDIGTASIDYIFTDPPYAERLLS